MKGIVSFYEKPGCKGNARQKQQLKDAGYVVQSVDMIQKKWNHESLMKFFGAQPPHQFVNERAPAITSKQIDPNSLNETELLDAMIVDPMLIMRPLLFFRGQFAVGFDSQLVKELTGSFQQSTACQSTESCK